MTEILKIENCKIEFTPKFSSNNCEIKLISGYSNEVFFDTKFEKYEENIIYWVSHPRLTIESNIKMLIYVNQRLIDEIIINEDLLIKNEKHIFNIIPELKKSELITYVNESYFEIFVDGNFSAEKKCSYIFDDVSKFIDLGGNCGFFSRYIFNKNPKSQGVIVEPNYKLKNIIEYLNTGYNLKTEYRAFNVVNDKEVIFKFGKSLLDSAVSHENGIDFHMDNVEYETHKVQTISLQEILNKFENTNPIDILKVDIEGGEKYLLNESNLEILHNKVKYILIESHSDEIYKQLNYAFNEIKFENISTEIVNGSYLSVYRNTKLTEKRTFKKILVKVESSGMGDVLCSTPTIRKISQTYSQKIDVMTKRLDVYQKNPYVDNLLTYGEKIDGYDEVFDTFHFLLKFNKPNSKTEFTEKPMEIKMSNFEARQLHALGVGLTLYPEEMHYDFIPDEPTTKSQLIDKNTLVLHVTESWPSRTWSPQKWQRLIDLIKEKTNFKICLIGRSHSELGYFGIINKSVIDLKNIDYDFTIRGENINQSDNDRESLSEMWHIINNSYGLISFDAGPIHLAGVTDSWIFQIGASVRYEKTAPYRNQSQNYKFYFIGGECKLMCASDPKYAVKEWGSINSNPYYPNCQEGYSEFKCHPTPEMIVNKIIESYSI